MYLGKLYLGNFIDVNALIRVWNALIKSLRINKQGIQLKMLEKGNQSVEKYSRKK